MLLVRKRQMINLGTEETAFSTLQTLTFSVWHAVE